ncbi:MAG: ankyrin repeat domain-containing protein, partial [Candidatus Latescibacteria bacterium]|nr:ankyrin repeat domain-containing protein [Candidatus Latescibacterota bacterium]
GGGTIPLGLRQRNRGGEGKASSPGDGYGWHGIELEVRKMPGRLHISMLVLVCLSCPLFAGEKDADLALVDAAKRGDLLALQAALDKGADPDARAKGGGGTALMFAAYAGHTSAVRVLLSAGAKATDEAIAMANVKGHTDIAQLLQHVAMAGQRKAMDKPTYDLIRLLKGGGPSGLRALLDSGADVNAKDDNGVAPLQYAAAQGRRATVEMLLAAGAKPDREALMVAIVNGHDDVVEAFRKRGITYSGQRWAGQAAALVEKARRGDASGVRALVGSGTFNVKAKSAAAAMTFAAGSGHSETVAALLQAGVAPSSEAWALAVVNGHSAVVGLFNELGGEGAAQAGGTWSPDTTGTDAEGARQTLEETGSDLLEASKSGDANRVRELLSAGAPPDTRDDAGLTPLMVASSGGRVAIVKALLDAGAGVNQKSDTGWTALMLAADVGDEAMVRTLLDANADVDASGNAGFTALVLAVLRNRAGVVRMLGDVGADVNAGSGIGGTPLRYAKMKGYREVAQLLEAAGAVE